ncbi:MAG: trypsin-like peptidase domain-containing protein [Candidatus Izemoplasmatales bacterium]|jgi:S1-C subfamily serine protease|nr:trypsin-like peptidase domain-containing protein [Candidatus Izemoplasmatales bacterium]
MKKFLIFAAIILMTLFMVSCDVFQLPFFETTTTERTTINPTKINGTITFEDEDYQDLALYNSSNYDIEDVEEYNDLLLTTKNHIRLANIVVNTVIYSQKYPWGLETERQVVSQGSGFIFMQDDEFFYAITNFHVLDSEYQGTKAEIMTFSDTNFSEAEIVTFDESLDLAVLKFSINERTDVTVIDIFERLYYQFIPGELVLAVGNPSSLNNNVTFGEFKSMETLKDVNFKVIYHDAAIANGSSGGALVDVDGNLLGVNTWGLEDSDEFSFAIPNYIVYMFLINNGILD